MKVCVLTPQYRLFSTGGGSERRNKNFRSKYSTRTIFRSQIPMVETSSGAMDQPGNFLSSAAIIRKKGRRCVYFRVHILEKVKKRTRKKKTPGKTTLTARSALRPRPSSQKEHFLYSSYFRNVPHPLLSSGAIPLIPFYSLRVLYSTKKNTERETSSKVLPHPKEGCG